MFENKKKEISPIFITGAWRSGTTLISRMLNNHPDLEITYDTVHFMRFSYNRYNPIKDKKNVKKLIIDTTKRLLERYNLKISPDEVLKIIDNKYNYEKIYDSLMKVFLLQKNKKKIWGEKTNLAWTKVPDFFKMYPKGRVLHIVRDPRAVLYSWKKFTTAPGNDYLDSIINCFDSMEKAILYKKIYREKRYSLLKYEDLVSNPDLVLRNLCKKFKLKYNPIMLNTKIFTDLRGNKWRANSVHKKMKGISKNALGEWKKNLFDWEIFLTEKIFGDLLNKFNYIQFNNKSEIIIKKTINEIQKSKLATLGVIQFLLSNEGLERYPSNPFKKKNWGNEKI